MQSFIIHKGLKHRIWSGREKEKERKLKRVNTDISTQFKDKPQDTTLVLIYEPLLPILLFCLLERISILFLSLLADCKDLDVDNSLVP